MNTRDEKVYPPLAYDPSEDKVIVAFKNFYNKPIEEVVEAYIADPLINLALEQRFAFTDDGDYDTISKVKLSDVKKLREIAAEYESTLQLEENNTQKSQQALMNKILFLGKFYHYEAAVDINNEEKKTKSSKYSNLTYDKYKQNIPHALTAEFTKSMETLYNTGIIYKEERINLLNRSINNLNLARYQGCPEAARALYLSFKRKYYGQLEDYYTNEMKNENFFTDLLLESAKRGNPFALHDLGNEYKKKNIEKAKDYYCQAAMLGNQDSICELIEIYCCDESKVAQGLYYIRFIMEEQELTIDQQFSFAENLLETTKIDLITPEEMLFVETASTEIKYHIFMLKILTSSLPVEFLITTGKLSEQFLTEELRKKKEDLFHAFSEFANENYDLLARLIFVENSWEKVSVALDQKVKDKISNRIKDYIKTIQDQLEPSLPKEIIKYVFDYSLFSPRVLNNTNRDVVKKSKISNTPSKSAVYL